MESDNCLETCESGRLRHDTLPGRGQAGGGMLSHKSLLPLNLVSRAEPRIAEVLYELPSGAIMKFMIHEGSGGGVTPLGNVELFGTKGNLGISDFEYKVVPSRPGQFQTWDQLIEPEEYAEDKSTRVDTTSGLIRNFLDRFKICF